MILVCFFFFSFSLIMNQEIKGWFRERKIGHKHKGKEN